MDFGNAALVHVRHLREMQQEFMSLPFQVCSSENGMFAVNFQCSTKK